jgi:hypothetical protein
MAKTEAPKQSTAPVIPAKYQDLAALGVILLILLIYFGRVIFGANTLQAGDSISYNAFVPFIEAEKHAGQFPLWIPNIFSGMPAYGSLIVTGDRWFDVSVFAYMKVEAIVKAVSSNPDVMRIVFEYWVMGIGMYLYMRRKKFSPMIGLFAALAFVFSSQIIVLVMIGHNTKVWALMCMPYLFLCVDALIDRWRWTYALVLVVVAHLCIESTHVQMVYNVFLGLGVYLLVRTFGALKRKESMVPVLRALGAVIVAGGIGAGMAADRYLSVQEYNVYSIRGTGPIVQSATGHSTEGGGLDYEYATNWSFSPEEVLTFFVPGYYGNGQLPYPYKGQIVHAHGYWGQAPFVDLPNYMGILVILLAGYAVVRRFKTPGVPALATMAIVALFISFGRNLSFLYDLLFNYAPFFNKFRAPSQMLAVMQFAAPVLAAFGLREIIDGVKGMDERKKKTLMYWAIACGAWVVIGLIMQSTGKDSYIASVEESRKSELPGDYVFGVAMGDWLRCGLFALAFFIGAWLYVRGKLAAGILVAGAIAITVIDLMWIDSRRMDVIPRKQVQAEFQKTDVIDFLQQDKSLYRIYDITGAPNMPTYWNLQHIVGYQAAKLRAYQDMLDVAGVGGSGLTQEFVQQASRANGNTGGPIANALLWNLLGTKYIIAATAPGPNYPLVFASKSQKIGVFSNPGALPRAFFVKGFEVKKGMDILMAMRDGSFNPTETMMLESAPSAAVVAPDSTANVKIDSYGSQKITLTATASGTNLLLLSETYYKPAWKAYIDGKETEVLKADYVFRGVVVPAGTHTIEFRYESSAFEKGKSIALGLNVVVLGVLAVVGVLFFRGRKEEALPSGTAGE